MSDNCKITVDKSCGLSVIPQVDLTPIPCEKYISTECILQEKSFVGLDIEKDDSQTIFNEAVDEKIRELNQRIKQLDTLLKSNKPLTYQKSISKTFCLTDLNSNDNLFLVGEQNNIIPKFVEIRGTSTMGQPILIDIPLTITLRTKTGTLYFDTLSLNTIITNRSDFYYQSFIDYNTNFLANSIVLSKSNVVDILSTNDINFQITLYYDLY